MKRVPVHMCFKGNRNYLQGADLYNAIVKYASKTTAEKLYAPFRMVIHRFAHKQCDMILGNPGEILTKPGHLFAEFIFSSDEGNVAGWMVETERVIDCRNPYDEKEIERLCVIDVDKKATVIQGDSGYSPIELAVSMTKQLHYAVYPTDASWIFNRLDLEQLFKPSDSYQIQIELEHNFNNRLTKSKIKVADETIGYIYFSLIKK